MAHNEENNESVEIDPELTQKQWIKILKQLLNLYSRDFPGGAVVKNPPSNAGDAGSNPGQGTRFHMHAVTKNSHATTKEPMSRN